MDTLETLSVTLLPVGRLLLRNRELGKAAVGSSGLPQPVKHALDTAFDGSNSNADAIERLKHASLESVRAAGGILEWLQHSSVERQSRRGDSTAHDSER